MIFFKALFCFCFCVSFIDYNSALSYIACPVGQELRNNRCEAIDECRSGRHRCGANQICLKTDDGYACKCKEGYQVDDSGWCQDINECYQDQEICSPYSTCVNTPGSYTCVCYAGFRKSSESMRCEDINECQEQDNLCDHACYNKRGSYSCGCQKDYSLMPNKRSCSRWVAKNPNTVITSASGPHRMTKLPEAPFFYPTPTFYCPDGFETQRGMYCVDIDECANGQKTCDKDEVCVNLSGSARCASVACESGYTKEVLKNKHSCHRPTCGFHDYECRNMTETYSFSFIPITGNYPIHDPNQGNFYYFRYGGNLRYKFELKLVSTAGPHYVTLADFSYFKLTLEPGMATVAMAKSLEGPQDIQLELIVKMFYGDQLYSTRVSKIFLFVTENTF